MTESPDSGPCRVRPHVARTVRLAGCVLLNFDGVMFDVQTAMGPRVRERAVQAMLDDREHRPRSLLFPTLQVSEMLAFLARHEPDHATEAEALVTGLELDAVLTAQPARGLRQLLLACAASRRKVAVVSDLGESAVVAGIRANELDHLVDVVAARQGLNLSTCVTAAERAADVLGVPPASCLVVSGSSGLLHHAARVGMRCLGCECGRERRKHLAWAGGGPVPVVPRIEILSTALLADTTQ